MPTAFKESRKNKKTPFAGTMLARCSKENLGQGLYFCAVQRPKLQRSVSSAKCFSSLLTVPLHFASLQVQMHSGA